MMLHTHAFFIPSLSLRLPQQQVLLYCQACFTHSGGLNSDGAALTKLLFLSPKRDQFECQSLTKKILKNNHGSPHPLH